MKASAKFRQWLATRDLRETGYAAEVANALDTMELALARIAAGAFTNPHIAAQEVLERLGSDQQEIDPQRFTAGQQAVRIVGHLEERFRPFGTEADRAAARQFVEDMILGRVNLS